MRPREPEPSPESDLFRSKLTNLLDLRHELCRVAERIPWEKLAEEFGGLYAEAGHPDPASIPRTSDFVSR
jgi:transposase, IS5 family